MLGSALASCSLVAYAPVPVKVDETQANLAFVALRQEPFLVEEFDYLADQLRDLHEVRQHILRFA